MLIVENRGGCQFNVRVCLRQVVFSTRIEVEISDNGKAARSGMLVSSKRPLVALPGLLARQPIGSAIEKSGRAEAGAKEGIFDPVRTYGSDCPGVGKIALSLYQFRGSGPLILL